MWEKKKNSGSSSNRKSSSSNRRRPDQDQEKRKFIEKNPVRTVAEVEREVDRSMFEVSEGSMLDEQEKALARQRLVYHESEPAGIDSEWMNRLKEDAMQHLAETRGVQLQHTYRESIYKKGMETLIDKVYSLLQRYTWEFNQVAAGTDLNVSGTISGDVTEVTQYNLLREALETEDLFPGAADNQPRLSGHSRYRSTRWNFI